jgi:flagellar biogenesis protein FliO
MTTNASHAGAAGLFLGVLAMLGLFALGKLWWKRRLSLRCESSLSLLSRLSLSPQSRAYLVDAEGARVLVVVAASSIAMQVIGAPADPRSFHRVLEDVQR